MPSENRDDKKVTVEGGRLYAQIPKYFIVILLTVMFIYPDRFATIFHGTPSQNLSAGKTENGNFSNKKLVSFWTPSACTSKDKPSQCTHNSQIAPYKSECNTPSKSRLDCKKLKKRIENGYYFVTEEQIEELENALMRAKANGFNYFDSRGASRGSPIKPGLSWEVTFSKNSDIDEKKLKNIVNRAFSRKEKTEKCTYTISKNQESTAESTAKKCWKDNITREPTLSVYAEIRG